MPVYYDDNEAIFDYIADVIEKTEDFVQDSYSYSSYIWGGDDLALQVLTVDEQIAYEDVIYATSKRFPHLSAEDVELYLYETMETNEEATEISAEDWTNELTSLLESLTQTMESKPSLSLILEDHR